MIRRRMVLAALAGLLALAPAAPAGPPLQPLDLDRGASGARARSAAKAARTTRRAIIEPPESGPAERGSGFLLVKVTGNRPIVVASRS